MHVEKYKSECEKGNVKNWVIYNLKITTGKMGKETWPIQPELENKKQTIVNKGKQKL